MQFSRSYLLRRPKSSSGKRRLAIIMAAAMLLALAVFLAVHVISTFNMLYNRAEWAQALRLQGRRRGELSCLRRRLLGRQPLRGAPGFNPPPAGQRHGEPGLYPRQYADHGRGRRSGSLGRLYRRLGNPAFIELVQDLTGLPVNHYLELRYEGLAWWPISGNRCGGAARGAGEALIPAGRKIERL